MGIFHKFRSNKSDGVTPIKPSDWNAKHSAPDNLVWCLVGASGIHWMIPEHRLEYSGGAGVAPYAETPGQRTRYDFKHSQFTKFSAHLGTIGGGTQGFVQMEYSVDSVIWAPISNAISVVGTDVKWSNFMAIPEDAKQPVWIRIVGYGGRPQGDVTIPFGGFYLYAD